MWPAHAAGPDLLAIIARIIERGQADLFGVTGSFLVGCFNTRSDIDLVCYGPTGYHAAHHLFAETDLIRPYAGDDLTQAVPAAGQVHGRRQLRRADQDREGASSRA